ncbi:MAG: putative addiction module antidote protein [Candidatus Electrothrix sp. AUS4]|nr:putative addiction module antidote protein [Candidatus Electrothrix sp. AUS4]
MDVTTSKWDASEYLDSPEMMKEYLQIMLEENGVEGFQRALGDIAKAKGMTEIARATKLGRQNLYKALAEGSSPKFDTVKKVVEALGCKIAIV